MAEQGTMSLHLAQAEYTILPGASLSIPVTLRNRGPAEDVFKISVWGLPAGWVTMPLDVYRLAAGEERQVAFTVQPMTDRAGRYPFTVRVSSQSRPDQATEVSGILTVAAYQTQGRIGLLLAATEFSVTPGKTLTIPLLLHNRGIDEDAFSLSVEGIPTAWVSTPSPTVRLAPGQQQETTLTIQPPLSAASQAGRRIFRLRVRSHLVPDQAAEAPCTLHIAAVTGFSSELHPRRIAAGQAARVVVENRGNIQQVFDLTWQSPDDDLTFTPAPSREVRVAAGQAAQIEFRASPRNQPLLGGDRSYGYTVQVRAADQRVQRLHGEVIGKALLPNWVLPAVLIGLMILACLWALVLFVDLEPGEKPLAEAPPVQETAIPLPAEPTQPPPVEPTQPPAPEPTLLPAPTEGPPPAEPTSSQAEIQPVEPPALAGRQAPCAAAALPLVFAPLFIIRHNN